jgi:hypothetical protein
MPMESVSTGLANKEKMVGKNVSEGKKLTKQIKGE